MEIGFLPITLWDLLDVLIVGYLLFQSYKLLRGSVAINIFIGVVTLIVLSWIVRSLNMELLSSIIGLLISTGVIILIIVFQPEVRRFLLLLGNNTLRQRSKFLDTLLDREAADNQGEKESAKQLKKALFSMSKRKEGALIILNKKANLEGIAQTGVRINADISRPLLENIFFKNSPLHDGAMLIENDKIIAAGCILPLSDSVDLPQSVGLRHRAAVGITERTEVAAFVVSEETGTISLAVNGKLYRRLSKEKVDELVDLHL
ncbi:MAG: diadenylate cyclase [Saprospiraceae bacterium]|jgi:diadenylate cyclase